MKNLSFFFVFVFSCFFIDLSAQCDSFKVDLGVSAAQQTDMICAPKVVSFRDLTQFNKKDELTEWKWQFGDERDSSLLKDPFHTYLNNGKFSVSLEVKSKNGCSQTIEKKGYITVAGPVADFSLFDDTACIFSEVHLINDVNKHGLLPANVAKNATKLLTWDTVKFSSNKDTILLLFFEERKVDFSMTVKVEMSDPILGKVTCSDTYPDTLTSNDERVILHVIGDDFEIDSKGIKYYIEDLNETLTSSYWVLDGRDTVWNKDTVEYKRKSVSATNLSGTTNALAPSV